MLPPADGKLNAGCEFGARVYLPQETISYPENCSRNQNCKSWADLAAVSRPKRYYVLSNWRFARDTPKNSVATMHIETTGHEICGAGPLDASSEPVETPLRSENALQSVLKQAAVSPSLQPAVRGEPSAFEVKFLLDESRARDVEQHLAARLALDPHSDRELENAYRVTSIYCDTPDLDVFHRVGSHRRRKYRVRRYGSEPGVFLERKTKQGERVRKRRTQINGSELPSLSSLSHGDNWPGRWFHDQLLFRRLEPVCCVQYLRTAYVGVDADGPLRLTFDRDIRSAGVNDWTLALAGDGLPALADLVVCEFKFRGALPALFKTVIQALALEPAGVSKYRHCYRAVCSGVDGSAFDGEKRGSGLVGGGLGDGGLGGGGLGGGSGGNA
jgi:hypothetical protein